MIFCNSCNIYRDFNEYSISNLYQQNQQYTQKRQQQQQRLVPQTTQTQPQLPRLEHQSPVKRTRNNNNSNNLRYRIPQHRNNENKNKNNRNLILHENINKNNTNNSRKRSFCNISAESNNEISLSQSSTHKETTQKEKDNTSIEPPPHKRQKIMKHSNINNNGNNMMHGMNINNNMSFMVQDTKMRIISNLRHFNTMSDEELHSKICTMRNKMNRTINSLQNQCSETLDLMEVAHQRYLYSKQEHKQQRDRANHYQSKVESLQKKLIENHNMLFKMFEQ